MPRPIQEFFRMSIDEKEHYLFAVNHAVRQAALLTTTSGFVEEDVMIPKQVERFANDWIVPTSLDDLVKFKTQLEALGEELYQRNHAEPGADEDVRIKDMVSTSAFSAFSTNVNQRHDLLHLQKDCSDVIDYLRQQKPLDENHLGVIKIVQEQLNRDDLAIEDKLKFAPNDRMLSLLNDQIVDIDNKIGLDGIDLNRNKKAALTRSMLDILESNDSSLMKVAKLKPLFYDKQIAVLGKAPIVIAIQDLFNCLCRAMFGQKYPLNSKSIAYREALIQLKEQFDASSLSFRNSQS